MNQQDFKDQVEELLKTTRANANDVALFISQRAAILSAAVGQPGYDSMLRAERDNVALYAGLKAVDVADAADARAWGIVETALSIGAKALA